MTRFISGAYFITVVSIPPFKVKSLTLQPTHAPWNLTSAVSPSILSSDTSPPSLARNGRTSSRAFSILSCSELTSDYFLGEQPAIVVIRTISVGGRSLLRFATSLTILRAISSKANGMFVPSCNAAGRPTSPAYRILWISGNYPKNGTSMVLDNFCAPSLPNR